MIRRILDFIIILLFMWVCMILGLWFINEVIVPLELPGINSRVITAMLKVAAGTGLALFWLWLWREIIKRMFWHALRSQERSLKRAEDKRPETKDQKEEPRKNR